MLVLGGGGGDWYDDDDAVCIRWMDDVRDDWVFMRIPAVCMR